MSRWHFYRALPKIHSIKGVVAGGPWPPQILRNHPIFRIFNALSENSPTFAVSEDKGLELYRKIIELGPSPYYTCATMPLHPMTKSISTVTRSLQRLP